MAELDEAFNVEGYKIAKEFYPKFRALTLEMFEKSRDLPPSESLNIYCGAAASSMVSMLTSFGMKADDAAKAKNIMAATIDKLCGDIAISAKDILEKCVSVGKAKNKR
jgi:hypothetical protein